jgi:group I intron endonuclease
MEDKSGVYIIKNAHNGKVYIGSSVNMHTRLTVHLKELNANSHINDSLQDDWNKYGKDSFLLETLEECDKDILKERERFHIREHNSMYDGYNIAAIGLVIKKGSQGRVKMVSWRLRNSTIDQIKELSMQSRKGINEFVQELLDMALDKVEIE